MLPVLDNQGIREADRHTISDLGVPGIVLMENAATGVVDALRERFPEVQRVVVLCGPGNNGGDGLAAARHLHNGGHEVRVLLFADPEKLSPDATTNYRLAVAFGVPVEIIIDNSISALDEVLNSVQPSVVMDALLGTGLDRPLGGRLAEVAEKVAETGLPVVAVDVPTGLNGSSSIIPGPVLPADLTVTFAALKLCHALPPACLQCGEIAIVDIGIPPQTLEKDCRVHWVETNDVAMFLPSRQTDAHKGHFGHLLILGGGEGRGGAVAMAAQGAVVTGAGLVTMAVPQPAVPVVDASCLEAMTHPLTATENGEVAGPEGLEPLLERMTAVAVGPGMGTGAGAKQTLDWLLDSWQGPLLLDADALNLIAGNPERLTEREVPPVLTPHPGELGRLLGRTTEEITADRISAAREAARRAQAVVIAKGFRSVIAEPDGEIWINTTGDSGLASGGSGDVLTGIVSSLLAQGAEPTRAATVGSWLHGRAGEFGSETYTSAVPASTLPEYVARSWKELEDQ